jgi:hypothetical protein
MVMLRPGRSAEARHLTPSVAKSTGCPGTLIKWPVRRIKMCRIAVAPTGRLKAPPEPILSEGCDASGHMVPVAGRSWVSGTGVAARVKHPGARPEVAEEAVCASLLEQWLAATKGWERGSRVVTEVF